MTSANGNGQHSGQANQNKPRLVFWELTKGCNLRCIHCRASATELSSPSDLSTQSACEIIDQIAEVSTPILVLSGGEPLFRSDIFQLARYGTDKGLRVALATTHLPLREVSAALHEADLVRILLILQQSLRRYWGIAQPHVAVCGLNPHAGEGGLFGRQDIDVSQPTIDKAVADGLDVVGPVPGDTVFVKLRAGQYDAVVAMYHDQGHIPVKLLGFEVDPKTGKWQELSGVNITLGLPIIRTSVDHGTAFDIAGKGIANERSMIEAIEYAERLAGTA